MLSATELRRATLLIVDARNRTQAVNEARRLGLLRKSRITALLQCAVPLLA
jgi:hypothetical protein